MAFMIVDLNISAEEYIRWYQGNARAVTAKSRDGRRIQFPASCLQPFVQHAGVKGTFAIYFDENNKLQRVERLA